MEYQQYLVGFGVTLNGFVQIGADDAVQAEQAVEKVLRDNTVINNTIGDNYELTISEIEIELEAPELEVFD